MSAAGIKCQHCGEAAREGSVFCAHCGQGISTNQMGRGADEDVYLELVTANVLRLRRQWLAAEAKCSEVLRREPDSAEAYSLMGDISRDQGKLRDAIEWYKLALDRDPGSAGDRKKLEGVIDRVFAGGGRGPGLVATASARLRQLVGRVGADLRGAKPPCPALVVLGVTLLGVVVVIAVSAMLVGRAVAPPETSPQQISAGGFETGVLQDVAPVATERVDVDGLAAETISLESALSEHLRRRARVLDPNCQVISVEVAPESSMVRLWLSVPRVWGGAATRTGIERVALGLAAEAASWDERIRAVRVRCDMREGEEGAQLALTAKGSAGQVAKARGGWGERVEDFFSSVWWHPELEE